MTILYVDANNDDSFFFARSLKQAAPATDWRHIGTIHDAKCYLKGEGRYQDRNEYPFPQLVIADSKLLDGMGLELLQWARSQLELAAIPFCLFTELGDDLRGKLPSTSCVFQKPSELNEWPLMIKQMLQWLSRTQK